MRFNITILDEQDARFSHLQYDTCKYLAHALESLGYECRITRNELYSQAINILLNSFRLRTFEAVQRVQNGGEYIVLQSEMLTQRNINNWQDDGAFGNYIRLLKGARAVWEGMAANVPILNEFNIRSHLFHGGYHPHMQEIVPKRCRDIDFLFYGSISQHRKNQINRLMARGHNVKVLTLEPALFRNDCIARAKVHLAPWHSELFNQHLAWGRICYLLNNRGLVVVERVADQAWLEDCFISADSTNWVDTCIATLERPDREALTQSLFERFKKISFTNVVQELIAKL